MTQNCYKSIKVSDTRPERDNNRNYILTTINCDGVLRFWESDSMDDFIEWWHDENYDGPAYDDKVIEFSFRAFNGRHRFNSLHSTAECDSRDFGSLLSKFGKV